MSQTMSLKSAKSELTRSVLSTYSDDGKHLNLDDFLSNSCKQFNCPIPVIVSKELQREIIIKGSKKHESKFRRKSFIPPPILLPTSDDDTKTEKSQSFDDEALLVTTYYDVYNRLQEIQMIKYRYHPIPRILLKLIALITPFNTHLNKFTIKNCKIDMYTIYELSKILPVSNITDVCLDHSPLREGNYDILLRETSCIRHLSLSRCNINDIVCERIAKRLCFLEPAECTLIALNLSSNYITDVGAEHLGTALRTNRHLRYLNLASNQITDTGALFILEVLQQFPLTPDEVINKRKRFAQYFTKKQALLDRFKTDDNGSYKKSSKRSTPVKNKPAMKREKPKDMTDEGMKAKLEMIVLELLGPFQDPFSKATTKIIDSQAYCVGNLVLCYLNLAYNSLSFVSIQKLHSIIFYQRKMKNADLCGLLNVVVDGNYLPESCKELDDINNILLKHIACFGTRSLFDKGTSKRKSIVAIATPERKQPLSSS